MDRSTLSCRRGVALLEVLVAAMVGLVGLQTLAMAQRSLARQNDFSRNQSQALHWAQRELESLRALASQVLPPTLLPPDRTETHQGTEFAIRASIQQAPGDAVLWHLQTRVRWADRHGHPHEVQLATLVAQEDALGVGALTLRRPPPEFLPHP